MIAMPSLASGKTRTLVLGYAARLEDTMAQESKMTAQTWKPALVPLAIMLVVGAVAVFLMIYVVGESPFSAWKMMR